MQVKMGQTEGFTMQLSCGHTTIHIVNDVATCTECGQTLGPIDIDRGRTERAEILGEHESSRTC
jgi:hypothetical protein